MGRHRDAILGFASSTAAISWAESNWREMSENIAIVTELTKMTVVVVLSPDQERFGTHHRVPPRKGCHPRVIPRCHPDLLGISDQEAGD